MISTDIVTDLVKQIDFKELMGEQVQAEISSVLERTGIPNEYVDYVLENQELKEYMGIYIAEGLDYILYEKEPPVISEKEITKLLSNSFDQVITELENHNIEVSTHLTKEQQDEIHEKIEVYVPKIVEKIPEVESLIEDKVSENEQVQEARKKLEQLREMNEKVQFVYQMQPTILMLAILQLALIIVIKHKKFRFIKWLFLPFTALAVILRMFYEKVPPLVQQHYPEEMGFLKAFIDRTLNSIFEIWKDGTQLYFILAILLVIFQVTVIGIHIYQNRRRKDMDIL